MSGHCKDCKNNPCVCDATPVDHIPDISKMVENLRAIADSLTDWDNPIDAKSEIENVIETLYEAQIQDAVHKMKVSRLDKACIENDRMREWLEMIIKHTKIISPTGYKMTGYYAMAMTGLGRKGEME